MGLYRRKITVSDDTVTSAAHLTLKQSLVPCFLGMLQFLLMSLHGLT
jgi:MFS transporter, FHS family, L-fucose permease